MLFTGERRRDQADGQGSGVAQSRRALRTCAGGSSLVWRVSGWPVADHATVTGRANREYGAPGAAGPESVPQAAGSRDNSGSGGLFCESAAEIQSVYAAGSAGKCKAITVTIDIKP